MGLVNILLQQTTFCMETSKATVAPLLRHHRVHVALRSAESLCYRLASTTLSVLMRPGVRFLFLVLGAIQANHWLGRQFYVPPLFFQRRGPSLPTA